MRILLRFRRGNFHINSSEQNFLYNFKHFFFIVDIASCPLSLLWEYWETLQQVKTFLWRFPFSYFSVIDGTRALLKTQWNISACLFTYGNNGVQFLWRIVFTLYYGEGYCFTTIDILTDWGPQHPLISIRIWELSIMFKLQYKGLFWLVLMLTLLVVWVRQCWTLIERKQ